MDEKAASALIVVKMDRDDLKGEALQCRVVMGKGLFVFHFRCLLDNAFTTHNKHAEPDHFLALWDNKMVVHDGGHASGFKNRFDKDTYDTDGACCCYFLYCPHLCCIGVSFYQLKSTDAGSLRTVQVPEVCCCSFDIGHVLSAHSVFVCAENRVIELW